MESNVKFGSPEMTADILRHMFDHAVNVVVVKRDMPVIMMATSDEYREDCEASYDYVGIVMKCPPHITQFVSGIVKWVCENRGELNLPEPPPAP